MSSFDRESPLCDAPQYLRAALVTAAFADADVPETWAGLGPDDRDLLDPARRALRAAPDRRGRAEALVRARHVLVARVGSRPDPTPGARFYARWLRAIDAPTRARVLRALNDDDQRRIAAFVDGASALAPPHDARASWLMAMGNRCFDRIPTTAETAAFFAYLGGDLDAASAPVVRWERLVRVMGRRAECEALARAVAEP